MNREFNEDELSIFIHLQTAKSYEVVILYEHLKKKSWVLKAIEKRVEIQYNNRFDLKTQIMILAMSDGAIGIAVKYLADIVRKADFLELKEITFNDFCLKIYPFGIPNL